MTSTTAALATVPTLDRGTRVGHDISDATSGAEALRLAGLDWTVEKVSAEAPLSMLVDGEVVVTSMPDFYFTMRSDTKAILGAVKGRYQEIDNHVFEPFVDAFLTAGGRMTDGGAREHGRRVYMRGDLPGATVSLSHRGDKDLVSFGLVFKTSHDGTGNITAAVRGTRLVCTNGMVASIKGLPDAFNIKHTNSAEERLQAARGAIQGAVQYAKGFSAIAQHMLDTRMDDKEFIAYVDSIYPKPVARTVEEEGTPGFKTRLDIWNNRRDELVRLFKFAETNHLGRGTRWGAYNAVTEFVDWGSTVRVHRAGGDPLSTRRERLLDDVNRSTRDAAFLALV